MPSPVAEMQAVLDRFDFKAILAMFSPRLFVEHGNELPDEAPWPRPRRGGLVTCALELTVPDRDTHEPFVIRSTFQLRHGASDRETQEHVWNVVMELITHEVDESLLYDGSRPFDPHGTRPERRREDGRVHRLREDQERL